MTKALVVLFAVTTAASVAGNVFLYNRYSTSRPLMRIGTDSISKKEYMENLEFRYGKGVLQELAFKKIVAQAAQKAGVTVTPQQLDERMREIERRTPEMLVAAKSSPANMARYRDMLQSKMLIEELRLNGVTATDREVADFYKRNEAAFKLPHQAQATVVIAKNAVDAATASALLKQGMRPDIIAEQPRLMVVGDNRYNRDWRQLPGNSGTLLNKMMYGKKQGDVVTVQTGGMFFVARISSISGGGLPPLGSNKALVTRLARLSKAPTEPVLLGKIYQDSNVRFEVSRYSDYFSDVETPTKQGGNQVALNR